MPASRCAISRRRLLEAATSFAVVGGCPALVHAAPAGPFDFIAPFSPGTVIDLTARYVASALSQRLSTTVLVDNRVGANGAIGTAYVARAAADGRTVLFTSDAHFVNRWISQALLPYRPVEDFAAVARLDGSPLLLLVPAESPTRSLADLLGEMRRRPGELTYSSAGVGSATHLCVVALNERTGTRARHIPYKGAAGAVTDAAGGRVAFSCQSPAVAGPLVKSARLRALAVTGGRPLAAFPDVPTVAQAGVPGFEFSSTVGAMVPAATPNAVVQWLSDEMVAIAGTAAFGEFCAANSMTVEVAGSTVYASEFPAISERWRRLVEQARNG